MAATQVLFSSLHVRCGKWGARPRSEILAHNREENRVFGLLKLLTIHFPQYITSSTRILFCSLFYLYSLAKTGDLVNLYNKCIQKYGCQILLALIKLQFTDYLLSSTPGNWYFYMHSLSTSNTKESWCAYLTETANEKFTTFMES